MGGDSSRNVYHCVVLYFSDSFHKNIAFSWSLVLYMCKVSVGSVSNILLMLTQSLYVVEYIRGTLTSTDDFLVTSESYYYRHFTIT